MQTERDAFLAALAENPDDNATRLIFADWLDDHDQPEEADRMQRWKASKEWLTEFAGKCGTTCTNYSLDTAEEDEKWEPITYETVMMAAEEYASGDGDGFCQDGSSQARDFFGKGGNRKLFWKHWSVVTGRRPVFSRYDPKGEGLFSCSC